MTYPYDLIILDVMLPGMDGFNLLQEVRRTKTTPVIMTTAKGMLEDKAT
ncbi:MAG: response regulator [bacterium]|nr:response regulator [bacterium]